MRTLLEQSLEKQYNQEIKINTSNDIYREMSDLKSERREILVVFHLNTKNQVISREVVSVGTLNASLVHPREVFRAAILNNANSIILSHNHPSGDTIPSDDDVTATKNLKNAGEIIGIKVLDHVVVGRDSYTSLKESYFI